MNEAKTPQTQDPRSIPREVGDRNALLISNHDDFNGPSPANEDADLTSNFVGKVGEKTDKFRRDNLLRRDSPSVNMFNSLDLTRFQTEDVAINSINLALLLKNFTMTPP